MTFTDAELAQEASHLTAVAAYADRHMTEDADEVVEQTAQNKAQLINMLGGWRKVVQVEVEVEDAVDIESFFYEQPLRPKPRWVEDGGVARSSAEHTDYVYKLAWDMVVPAVYARSLEAAVEDLTYRWRQGLLNDSFFPADAVPSLRIGQRLLPVALRLVDLKLKWLDEVKDAEPNALCVGDYDYYKRRWQDNRAAFERFGAALGAKKARKATVWVVVSAAPSTPLIFGTKSFDGKACYGPHSQHPDFQKAPGVIGMTQHMISVLAFKNDPTEHLHEVELGWEAEHGDLMGRGWGTMMPGLCAVHNIYAGDRSICVAAMRKAACIVAGVPEGTKGVSIHDVLSFNSGTLYFNDQNGATSVGDTHNALMTAQPLTPRVRIACAGGFTGQPERKPECFCSSCEEPLYDGDWMMCCDGCNKTFCESCWISSRENVGYSCSCRHHDVNPYRCGSCLESHQSCIECGGTVCENAPVSEWDNQQRCQDCHAAHVEAEELEAEAQAEADAQLAGTEEEEPAPSAPPRWITVEPPINFDMRFNSNLVIRNNILNIDPGLNA